MAIILVSFLVYNSFRKSVPEAPTDDILTVRHKTEKEKVGHAHHLLPWSPLPWLL